MARVAERVMTIGASPSNDVVAYRVRVVPTGNTVTYGTEYFETADLEVNVASIPALAGEDGDFDFYVSAVDRVGNESDFTVATGIAIDFFPPSPPSGVVFRES